MKKIISTSLLFTCLILKISAQPDSVTIAEETFGNLCWDTQDCTENIAPADSPGNEYHWDFDNVNTFTISNGKWIGGSDSSIRINNYVDGVAVNPNPSDYPDFSGNMHLHLCTTSDYNNSWDTVILSGINIDGFKDMSLSFGYVKNNNDTTASRGLVISVRVNGGSWVMLDSSLIPEDYPVDQWAYITLPIPSGQIGAIMDIRFSTVKTQIGLDDIKLKGIPDVSSFVLSTENFGILCWDNQTCGGHAAPLDYPGTPYHWDYDAVTSFSIANGLWIAGSDSSVRINNYVDDDAGDVNPPDPAEYPDFSGKMHLYLCKPALNSGSWDTVMLSGITVTGYEYFDLCFGYVKKFNGWTANRGLVISARIDDGPWMMIDTTLIPNNYTYSDWKYLEIPLSRELKGDVLDIRFSTRSNQIGIDDIALKGYEHNPIKLVESIEITGQGGATTINTDNGTLQMHAEIFPADAVNTSVTWSVTNGTGVATISETGILTAVANGTVSVIATAEDLGKAVGETTIIMSGQQVSITGITVTCTGTPIINQDDGTLQMIANLTPVYATENVTWSVNNTELATISPTGLLTAHDNGNVTVRATSESMIHYGEKIVLISNQVSALKTIEEAEFKIHPNPFSDKLLLENASSVKTIKITNLNGEVVSIFTNNGETSLNIDTSKLQSGLYIVEIKTKDDVLFVTKMSKK